ncbi:MAG: HAMP domain-containing histidine kinase [Agathobacter sp.]|nr:HAMP domain-containing histidine kinase [Agathobacter sp.]
MSIFYYDDRILPLPIAAIISGFLQGLLIKGLFSIKRFRKGMPFLFTTPFTNFSTFLFLLLIGYLSMPSPSEITYEIELFSLILFLAILACLIYWWQAQITKSYRRSLELRELESLRTEVAELNLKIQKLSEDNEKLARITHRDNTLITTLKNSTVRYLATDYKNPAEAIAARDKLISNINALSAGRTSLPTNYEEQTARNFDTGISLLDELLHHMDEKAIENKISFAVHLGTELTNFVPKDISECDLVHIVDDLLKNAFKSTLTSEKRVVQLQFYKLGKHFVIEVADNGIPFEVESLVNMGIEQRTTYADGSGIGLMDIWNTKDTYGATYHLEEYATVAPFSKKISLTFDKKNRYSIRTWRKNEILALCRRTDLQVYDYSE